MNPDMPKEIWAGYWAKSNRTWSDAPESAVGNAKRFINEDTLEQAAAKAAEEIYKSFLSFMCDELDCPGCKFEIAAMKDIILKHLKGE